MEPPKVMVFDHEVLGPIVGDIVDEVIDEDGHWVHIRLAHNHRLNWFRFDKDHEECAGSVLILHKDLLTALNDKKLVQLCT